MENNKDDKSKKASKAKTSRMTLPEGIHMKKINTETGKTEDITEEELNDNQRKQLFEALTGIKEKLEREIEAQSPTKNMKLEMAKQELSMTTHEVERRKLITLFDVVMNTKELLVQRIGDNGKADLQHHVSEKTKLAANNIINLCQKQIYTWLEKNNINGIKPGSKPTNPDDVTDLDLF